MAQDNAAAQKLKAAKAEAKKARRAASKERRKQMWQAFQMQRKEDKALLPIMIGVFFAAIVASVVIGYFFGNWWMFLILGILFGALGAFITFTRRLERSVYAKNEGQVGAAGWALENMRGSWRVNQAVARTTHADAVHRVIGKPGIILIAEGNEGRVRGLMAQEKKKTARVVGQTPIYEFVVGPDEGQVPLRKLQKQLNKLPSNINGKKIDELEGRLAALSNRGGGAQLPRGPLPQGAKMRSVQRTVRRKTGSN
ncbi:Integral membrane protein OS=Tsukamurella paurometabola (strain ATCC 8368 / DSM / CCUG 35730/ CIP 100753 / JCM 10117 / KCTC 9821 / NBRC 16120 / NCIMB 702349/ NCTC 13040) OX=521096 GN=Tpau_1512 PE=4 SV=1 [Tsukamurella paurometabola]|uniref:Integral membrane protein n=1 Tax=Tsukamurella paurometabola (strain ATCC 8368 / DSM 20162 / CCUG 35730 / CIP 100753 / JCM 10117 / KCTC 9821 / NBRC 16120 / NCIMB 702349 / NCTC 13040) TaxID=521096 RepID=D5UXP4_TSUPD|nr:DUF4191 domain-containing protein [Tsukamurella paurometabola]ADG78136.1 conserved hypothetical protein [Tsukamurella paurometabola DSM 20162]SUP30353.1 Uncharacterised protein [Tsukamurella paurometabola]